MLKPTGDTFDVFLRDLDDVDHLIGKAKTSSQPGEFEVISGAILDQFRAAAKKWERHFNIPASQSRLHRFRFR